MPQRILKTILIIMLVAFINVNTVINVNYVRAEEPTTQVITSDNTENENSTELTDTTIQETLSEISNNLNYMLIMQIISLGAFLGYVGIDRLR
jgi:hypothetical protein